MSHWYHHKKKIWKKSNLRQFKKGKHYVIIVRNKKGNCVLHMWEMYLYFVHFMHAKEINHVLNQIWENNEFL